MSEQRRKNLADILVNYSIRVEPEDWVAITANFTAQPLIHDVVEAVLKAGGHPTYIMESPQINETILRQASENQLKWVSPLFKKTIEDANSIVMINANENTRAYTNIDPERLQMEQLGQEEIFTTFFQRSGSGSLRWVGTLYPCQAFAQEADMSLREYEDFVYAATLADEKDPVNKWKQIHRDQQRLIDWLMGKKRITIRSPYVELSLSIEGRTFINDGGEKNMPGGEIYTSPVEDSANGWIEFSYPSIRSGHEMEGIRLQFKDGKVIKARAEKNEDYLIKILDTDAGARYLGEFAIGTNYGIKKFSKSILFDEKIGGTIHLATGRGFPEAGSKNISSTHSDMICNMHTDSEIHVDGVLFYKDGKFQV